MLIIMKPDSRQEEKDEVIQSIKHLGYSPHVIPGESRYAIGITGNGGPIDEKRFSILPGVQECIAVTKPYKLAGRDFNPVDTLINVQGHVIGGPNRTIIAGPCAIESEEQMMRIGKIVKNAGAHILRGGAFKPRTSPYSFQGLGVEGLKIMRMVGDELGLSIISEAIDLRSLEAVYEYADIIQIGARNMQNFSLLQEVGCLDKPVMLKRGPSATVDEVLCSAEYIMQNGNTNVMLCERGLRSFDKHTRNIFDIAFIPLMKELTHLPIIADPSHAAGRRDIIPALAKAAIAVGAHGVMVETHDRPAEALSDGPQSLLPGVFDSLVKELKSFN